MLVVVSCFILLHYSSITMYCAIHSVQSQIHYPTTFSILLTPHVMYTTVHITCYNIWVYSTHYFSILYCLLLFVDDYFLFATGGDQQLVEQTQLAIIHTREFHNPGPGQFRFWHVSESPSAPGLYVNITENGKTTTAKKFRGFAHHWTERIVVVPKAGKTVLTIVAAPTGHGIDELEYTRDGMQRQLILPNLNHWERSHELSYFSYQKPLYVPLIRYLQLKLQFTKKSSDLMNGRSWRTPPCPALSSEISADGPRIRACLESGPKTTAKVSPPISSRDLRTSGSVRLLLLLSSLDFNENKKILKLNYSNSKSKKFLTLPGFGITHPRKNRRRNTRQPPHFVVFQWPLDFVYYSINQSIDQSIKIKQF